MSHEPSDSSFSQAKIANEVIKVEKSKHQLQKLKDSVIDRHIAHDHIVQLIQRERVEWRAWPKQSLAGLAKRLAVNTDQLQALLQPSIDTQLQELGEINLRLN
jgi:ribosomal protein L19E